MDVSQSLDIIIDKIDSIKSEILKLKESCTGETFLDFDSLWEVYPKRDSKKNACKTFRANIKSADYENFKKAVARFAWFWSKRPKEELQYCPGMAPWINQEKWKNWVDSIPDWEKSKVPVEPVSQKKEYHHKVEEFEPIDHARVLSYIGITLNEIGKPVNGQDNQKDNHK